MRWFVAMAGLPALRLPLPTRLTCVDIGIDRFDVVPSRRIRGVRVVRCPSA